MANTANYFRLDASTGTVGVDLTAANIPTRSVTKGTGTIAKYFDDAAGRRWFRIQVASGVNGQFRTNANLVANNQSFRTRINVATTPITVTRLILGVRATSTSVGRVSMTPSRQLELAAATSDTTGTVLGTTTIAGGLPASDDFEVTLDTIVGTTTTNGVITLKVYPAGSNTPYAGGTVTSTTANLGTTAIQHYDIGSNQTGVAQVMDLRYADPQFDTNRTDSILAYPQVTAPVIPTGNYDVIVGWGQSNMAGPVYSTDTTNTYDATGVDAYPSNVYEFRNGSIVPAQEPLWSPDLNNAGMGAGNTFLKDYAASSVASGRQVLMVMCAYRGTGFATPSSGENTAYSWRVDAPNDGTNLYENAKTRVTAALAAAGPGSEVKAIIANHGSTDGTNNSPKAVFKAALQAAITGFRTWLGLPNVPFVMMQMRPDLMANETRHRIIGDAQAETANELPSVMYALSPGSTTDSTYFKSDSVHFNVLGQRVIGHNLYAQYTAPTQGSAAATVSLTTSAQGSTTASGSASTTVGISTLATGSTITAGTSQTNLSLSTSATGSRASSGSSATSVTLSTAGSGSTVKSGSSASALALTTTASGSAPAVGSASGSAATSVSLTTAATGSVISSGSSVGGISLTTSATGSRASTGVSATTVTTTTTASGSAPVVGGNSGAAATTITTSTTASGSTVKGGSASATLSLTTTASGSTAKGGSASSTITLTTAAAGSAPGVAGNSGSAAVSLTLTTSASGSTTNRGSANTTLTISVYATGSNGSTNPLISKHYRWTGNAWLSTKRITLTQVN